MTPFEFGEFRLILRHVLIQFMQVDVAENRAHARTLWRTGICYMVFPLIHVSGLKKFPHQPDELFVVDPLFQQIDQYMMVERVEARRDVAFQKPVRTRKSVLKLDKRRVAASPWSEPV